MVVRPAVDRFKAVSVLMMTSAISMVLLSPPLLLIPSSLANESFTRNLPPFFYRCDNGQTLVSRLDYEDQFGKREVLSVYPYPTEQRQQILWRSGGRQYINVFGREFECKAWNGREQTSYELTRGIPDPAALRNYVQRNEPTRLICTGGTAGESVQYWVSDFIDAGYRHGLMVVDGKEQFGQWYMRGRTGSFNHRGKYYYVYEVQHPERLPVSDDYKPVIHRSLVKNNDFEAASKCSLDESR